jgi:hypothetical protein
VTVTRKETLSVAAQPERVRVCHAATDLFTQKGGTAVAGFREVDGDTVQLDFSPGVAPGAERAECDFSGDQVTWRTVDTRRSAQFSPETVAFKVEDGVVHLIQELPDGGRNEMTWTQAQTGGESVTNINASTEIN